MQLQNVTLPQKSLGDYASISGRPLIEEIRSLAAPLQGKRVLHLSATAFGGGVAEINYTLIPLMRDAGLDAEWRVIWGQDEFFDVTKAIHNGLQGAPEGLSASQEEIFRHYNRLNAEALDGDWDYIIVHDPQPLAMIEHVRDGAPYWISRIHIDLSTPNREVLAFLAPWLARYDAAVFHRREYVPAVPGLPPAYIWPPAIDPLAPKNMALSPEDAEYILDQFAIDVERPLVTQVSRFDPWKDPVGVIQASAAPGGTSGGSARPRGVDGPRRPRGLGVLQQDARGGGRRSGHLHPLEPEQRRLDRGQRVPGALARARAEVDQGGLRAHCHRGALEGAPDRRRAGGRHRRPDRRGRDGLPRRLDRGLRRRVSSRSSRIRRPLGGWLSAARSTFGGGSSRRGSCATGSRFSTGSSVTRPGRQSSSSRHSSNEARVVWRCVQARRKLIVVSNRGPVTYRRDPDGGRVARRGGGGLVTALRSLVEHHDVTWVASAMTDADRELAEEAGASRSRRAPGTARRTGCGWWRTIRRRTTGSTTSSRTRCCGSPSTTSGRWRSARTVDHGLHHAWAEGYAVVNRGFADAVVGELRREPDAAVFFHDYHL